MADIILGIEEAAHYLSINVQAAFRLVQQGRLPAIKIGGLGKVKQAHLDLMLTKNLEDKLNPSPR